MHKKKGFTLIELLIVVAIIGILAAIAIPNFLEAQTRAKVSRVMGDMRTLGLALESYYVDWNQYPWQHLATANIMSTWWLYVVRNTGVDASAGSSLTTPIAYVSSIPIDPFTTQAYKDLPTYGVKQSSVLYRWKAPGRSLDWPSSFYGYGMDSAGPDTTTWGQTYALCVYDPTNGTISYGEIFYLGKGHGFPKAGW